MIKLILVWLKALELLNFWSFFPYADICHCSALSYLLLRNQYVRSLDAHTKHGVSRTNEASAQRGHYGSTSADGGLGVSPVEKLSLQQ